MKQLSLLTITTTISTLITIIQADSCSGNDPLSCQNNGVCLNGEKPYSNLGIPPLYDFLVPSVRGMHCSCPDESASTAHSSYTGVRCEVPYEVCDTDTMCFHGGYCATEQYDEGIYHCVCRQDENGDVWAGKHCEVLATNFCTDDKKWDIPGGRWFCTNGGTCQNGVSNLAVKCKCPEGTFGLHCEYNEYLGCSLQCENGGTCKVGLKDFSVIEQYGVNIESALNGQDFYGEHCVCPDGFSGPRCEISEVTRCGEGVCFNDAECVQTVSKDGETVYSEFCQCPTSMTVSYTGKFCEYQSTSFCPAPEGHDPSEYFCANGGECPNEPHEACICQTGFSGPKCEIPDNADLKDECDLPCENDGVCFFGQSPVEDETMKNLSNEGREFLADNKHCRCPEGFIGLRCEIKYNDCGGGKHYCLHGSECVEDGDEFTCDCREASKDFSAYAGKYCEHEATMYCQGPGQGSHSFCTNHGVCKGEVSKNGDHVGCNCALGWTGDYCEYESKATSVASKVFSSFVVIVFGGALCYTFVRYIYRGRDTIEYHQPGAAQEMNMAPYPYGEDGRRGALRNSSTRGGHTPVGAIADEYDDEDDDDLSMDTEYEFHEVKIV